MRTNDRKEDAMRTVEIIPGFTTMAAGSALISCGRTRVLCTASVEDGVPPFLRGAGQGWLTAEYAMLPGATPRRKPRDGVRRDGRSVEISRLIGRALRAGCDLTLLGERTITVDCDVLQADGGTRTAAITGGFVALCLAVGKLLDEGEIPDSPIRAYVAATSAGIVDGVPLLDLEYAEDSQAQVDMNLVMALDARGGGKFIEVQGGAEGAAFDRGQLDKLIDLGEAGIRALAKMQKAALGGAADVVGRKPRLIIASANFGKLREMKLLLGDRFDVASMREMGLDLDVEETGKTFEQNALIKAEALMKASGCAAVADDSGLEVDALSGRPGVRSARYAGVHGDDEANNQLLLRELEHVPEPRTARYVCAVALARPGRAPLVARAVCEGEILRSYRGAGGFGYDPLFLSHDFQKTFAEATMAEKNAVSHRARAIQKLMEALEEDV
jgi:ribonuclease PH/non-canonical purine NTP pyrophosphatase (RdgB/HAM1 family)